MSDIALETLVSAIGEKPNDEIFIPAQDENVSSQQDGSNDNDKIVDDEVHEIHEDDYVEDDDEDLDGEDTMEDISLGDIVPPEAALAFLNYLVPIVIVLMLRHAAGLKSKRKDFELTESEKKIMERPLRLFMKSLKINMNDPAVMFGICLVMVYGSKVIDKIDTFEKVPKKDKNKKDTENDESFEDIKDLGKTMKNKMSGKKNNKGKETIDL